MAKKKFSIDEGFSQLDDILKNLEQEDIKLADAVELYTKGVSTLKECKDSLDQLFFHLVQRILAFF